ncbi:MAG TPA: toxic anion resistance protein [Candidatus Dormibacteraeota bacterium]|nr:toxic anion resistance protein [Candidatus Dormibacteraeota bacterium]
MTDPTAAPMTSATSTEPLTPTDPDLASGGPATDTSEPVSALTLVPPAAVATVAPTQAADAVAIAPADAARLDQMVAGYLDGVMRLDVHDPAFTSRVDDIRKLGDEEVQESANVSNRLLQKPLAAMDAGGLTATSEVSRSLLDLRHTVEDLDPSKQGDLLSPSKLLGIIPFGNRLRDYFGRYQSSQSHIDAIIRSLYHGQDELQKDNADIEQEKANLWTAMGKLRQYAYLAQKLDDGLVTRIAAIDASDPDRAKTLRDDLLFPVRQKHQDLLTQLAVSVQGYLALDLIRRNNLELIKGVDRATTTTVSALRTAIIVAQALTDQKLVLDQITALNTTTGNIIESTSEMLRQQSGEVMEQAASSTIEIGKLQKAFDNIYATMDEIDTFKVRTLDNMQQTVTTLQTELDKAQTYVDRVRERDAQEAAGTGDLKL